MNNTLWLLLECLAGFITLFLLGLSAWYLWKYIVRKMLEFDYANDDFLNEKGEHSYYDRNLKKE